MSIRNLPGGVPEPEELFGREHLIDVLWKQLAGNNVLLVAPRRFGKTGVMRHVLKRPRPTNLPVYVDAENLSSPAAFAAELVAALLAHDKLRKLLVAAKRLPGRIVAFIKSHVEELGPDEFKVKFRQTMAENWESIAKKLILEMEKADETVIFIIDEFPQLVDNISRNEGPESARSFLAWFRSLRMRQKDELRRFRFILGGSTSVDMVLRRLDAPDKLNDFFRLAVGPLERDDAEALLHGLAGTYGLQFAQEGIDALLRLIGPPVPYFIHLFVSQVILAESLKGKRLTPRDVETLYRTRVLGPACRAYFDYYRQRLKRYGGPGERAAIAILRTIAAAPNGRVSDSALYDVYRKARKKGMSEVEYLEIMADLECDWYVSLDTATNEYHFLLDIMRDWWARFYRSIRPKGK